MARTPSTMVPLGSPASEFSLRDARNDKLVSLRDLSSGKGLVVIFLCNHCPYVKHIQVELASLAKEYQMKGIQFVGISSNDITAYPDDAPEKMKEEAEKFAYSFPYLFDESQEVAKAYDAACTPDFFVYDQALKLVYRGQFDDSRRDNGRPVTGADLRAALDAILQGEPVSAVQYPSLGCNIKWKA